MFHGPIPILSAPHAPQKGVTVGNGGADFNGDDETILERALQHSRVVEILPGTVLKLRNPLVRADDDLVLWSQGYAFIVPSTNASFGALSLTGKRVRLRGLHFLDQRGVANQTVVALQGDEASAEYCTFEQQAPGDAANSTHQLSFGNQDNVTRTLGGKNVGCVWYPNIGSVCLQHLFQDSPQTIAPRFTTKDVGVNRDCRAVFATNSCQGMLLSGVEIDHLGTVAQPMDSTWRERPNAIVAGGNVIDGFSVKSCRIGSAGVFFNGSTGWEISGVSIEDMLTLVDYFWRLEVSGSGRECSGINFHGGVFRNVGASGVAGAIDLVNANRVNLIGTQFLGCPNPQIRIAAPSGTPGAAGDPNMTMYGITFTGVVAIRDAGFATARAVNNGTLANLWSAKSCRAFGFGAASQRFWSTPTTGAFDETDIYAP